MDINSLWDKMVKLLLALGMILSFLLGYLTRELIIRHKRNRR